jgi:peroxiredoxin
MLPNPIAPGRPAPDFTLPAHLGASPLRLSSLRGQCVVLVFYVLDFTAT